MLQNIRFVCQETSYIKNNKIKKAIYKEEVEWREKGYSTKKRESVLKPMGYSQLKAVVFHQKSIIDTLRDKHTTTFVQSIFHSHTHLWTLYVKSYIIHDGATVCTWGTTLGTGTTDREKEPPEHNDGVTICNKYDVLYTLYGVHTWPNLFFYCCLYVTPATVQYLNFIKTVCFLYLLIEFAIYYWLKRWIKSMS